jgi:hypothetical protein
MVTRRRMLPATGGRAGLAAAGAAAAQAPNVPTQGRNGMMQITRNGPQPSRKGPAEYFTGAVRIGPLFQAPVPARVSGGMALSQATGGPDNSTANGTAPTPPPTISGEQASTVKIRLKIGDKEATATLIDSEWPDESAGLGGAHTLGLLCRLAERVFRHTGRQGCL